MERFFEVATKIVDGKKLTKLNEETGQEEVVKWDVTDECLPAYKTEHSVGADFCAVEDTVIPSIWSSMASGFVRNGESVAGWLGELIKNGGKSDTSVAEEIKKNNQNAFKPTLVHTGIKVKMPENEVLEIYNRSSGPMKGLVLANSVGIIDPDYYNNTKNDGEIMFAFYNFMPFDITIKKGEAIGQGIFKEFIRADKVVNKFGEELAVSVGGERKSGFGSTDEKEEQVKLGKDE